MSDEKGSHADCFGERSGHQRYLLVFGEGDEDEEDIR